MQNLQICSDLYFGPHLSSHANCPDCRLGYGAFRAGTPNNNLPYYKGIAIVPATMMSDIIKLETGHSTWSSRINHLPATDLYSSVGTLTTVPNEATEQFQMLESRLPQLEIWPSTAQRDLYHRCHTEAYLSLADVACSTSLSKQLRAAFANNGTQPAEGFGCVGSALKDPLCCWLYGWFGPYQGTTGTVGILIAT